MVGFYPYGPFRGVDGLEDGVDLTEELASEEPGGIQPGRERFGKLQKAVIDGPLQSGFGVGGFSIAPDRTVHPGQIRRDVQVERLPKGRPGPVTEREPVLQGIDVQVFSLELYPGRQAVTVEPSIRQEDLGQNRLAAKISIADGPGLRARAPLEVTAQTQYQLPVQVLPACGHLEVFQGDRFLSGRIGQEHPRASDPAFKAVLEGSNPFLFRLPVPATAALRLSLL